MKTIHQVSFNPRQKQTVILPDGTFFELTIGFKPMQYGWFIEELSYLEFRLCNFRICTSPNILHQFRNVIPFGIACFTKDNDEPMLQEDFSSGRSELFLLDEDETESYAETLSGQAAT